LHNVVTEIETEVHEGRSNPNIFLKGTVHPKREIVSSFTHTHVISDLYFVLLCNIIHASQEMG